MTSRKSRWIATAVLAPFIVFWAWFGIASSMGEKLGPVNWMLHLVAPAGALVALLAVGWAKPRIGGLLLALAGAVVAIGYPLTVGTRFPWVTSAMIILTMGLPPIVAGWIFVVSGRTREAGAA